MGSVPIIGSFGVTGTHDVARYEGPGVAIGRSGASIGSATFVAGPYWPLNTCLFVSDFKGNDARWVFHLLDGLDFLSFNSGSAQPSLNRNFLGDIPVRLPPLPEQQAIAEVLGALDDKIAANTALAGLSEAVASDLYAHKTKMWPRSILRDVLTPVLGGTPARSIDRYWATSGVRWASARDVTSAPSRVIFDTAESITELASVETKAKPLAAGSVIVTARGTVGEVARLAEPAAFNQSCYGFRADTIPSALLYFGLLQAMDQARSLAHGSVFDTITMSTFEHLTMPWSVEESFGVAREIELLLQVVDMSLRENRTLAATRDALLPQLMSGKLRVRDAEAAASAAGV